MANEEAYLRGILSLLGRQAFPPSEMARLVGREKQVAAYNLCDGSRTQAQIVKELSLDSGNFARTMSRWVEAGIIIKTIEGKEQRPVHLFPLPPGLTTKGKADGE